MYQNSHNALSCNVFYKIPGCSKIVIDYFRTLIIFMPVPSKLMESFINNAALEKERSESWVVIFRQNFSGWDQEDAWYSNYS